MNPTKTKSTPGLFQMRFFAFCGFYYVPNIFRCSVQSSGKPLRSLERVMVAGSSCPAVAFGEGRMPLRMASMMSGARLTRLNARKRKARSCFTRWARLVKSSQPCRTSTYRDTENLDNFQTADLHWGVFRL